MPYFHAHIYHAHFDAYDDEGLELANLSAAREAAIEGIRDIVSSEAQQGKIDFRGRIDIASPRSELLDSVSFSEAFEVLGLHDN